MIFASLILLLNILGLWLVTLIISQRRRVEDEERVEWPFITVWVAARNEEENIKHCLESLLKMDYPAHQMEILVGNDASSDNTAAIVKEMALTHPSIRLIEIDNELGLARNKANVLAHLAHVSKGDYFLICDADILVKETWAKTMVSGFKMNVGVVSAGVYIPEGGLLNAFQNLDWLFFSGLVKSATWVEIPSTALGNNMAVSKEAYWATGGFETLPTCITEDLQLYQEVLKKGYYFDFFQNIKAMSITQGQKSLSALLKQRKRWMTGGKHLGLFWKVVILFYALSFPSALTPFLFAGTYNYMMISALWMLSFWILLFRLTKIIGLKRNIFSILLFPLYSLLIGLLSTIFYFIPFGDEWKKRNY